MNREEITTKMAEAKSTAEAKAMEWNSAVLDNKPVDEVNTLETAVDDAVKEYVKFARIVAFDEILASEDPMVEACRRLDFDAIKYNINEDNDTKIKTMVVESCTKQIELKKLSEYAVKSGKTFGHDAQWYLAIEKFNFLMTLDRATQLGVSPERIKEVNDSYAMADMARQFDEGKNIISNTQELKSLAGVIELMLGDGYKPVSHDLRYLHMIYTKKGKGALKVSCANHRFMTRYIQEICHRIITGKTYDIEFKAKK